MEFLRLLVFISIAICVFEMSSAHPGHVSSCPEMTPCACDIELQLDINSTSVNDWVTTTILDCEMKKLTSVPNLDSIAALHIERLWLNYNKIEHVRENDFLKYPFQEVLMSANNIKSIHHNAFVGMKEVILKLTLSESRDLELSPGGLQFLSGLTNLRHLELRSTHLVDGVLKKGMFDVFNLTSLQFLNLENVNMTSIEKGALNGLNSLETLEIGYNLFEELPVELSRLDSLRELSIREIYGLRLTHESFKGMDRLNTLILSNIGLQIYPTAALERLDNLEELLLTFNEITELSSAHFRGKYALKHLDLGGNPILFVEGMFGRLNETLTSIGLLAMNISRPPTDVLRELPYLESLELEDCNITHVDECFFSGLSISSIDLSFNENLQSISPDAFLRMRMPLRLQLRNTALTDISFLSKAKPCSLVFKFLDLHYANIPCDCDLERVIHSGQIGGNVTGTCDFGDWTNLYHFIVSDSRIVSSIPNGFESELVSKCGRTKREHWCSSSQGRRTKRESLCPASLNSGMNRGVSGHVSVILMAIYLDFVVRSV